MTIKYGEIYVKHNTENLWTSTVFWLGYDEQTVSEDSTIIVKFDDGDVQEVSNELFETNNKIKIGQYITITNDSKEHMYFKRDPKKNPNGTQELFFGGIFKNYKNYDANNNIGSYSNCIYYKHKLVDTSKVKKMDVFAILRVKSSVSSPIYQVAYDSDDFSKEAILYLINCIFRDKPTQPS
jgi:hypothetical protein